MAVPKAVEGKSTAFSSKHAPTSISFEECSKPLALVMKIEGSLDSDNSNDFRELASIALRESRASGGLVIELSSVNYISSTGVGAFANILAEAKSHNIPFFLRGMTERTKAVFDLLGFTSFFEFLDDSGGER
jgi:anti-sigma B factor antagonist